MFCENAYGARHLFHVINCKIEYLVKLPKYNTKKLVIILCDKTYILDRLLSKGRDAEIPCDQ